jgi:SIR2-like domain
VAGIALREFLRHPDCVIFIGSGISMWSGLPSWAGFLADLAVHLEADGQSAELVRREIGHGDLLQAASYAMSKMTPASFGAFIRKAVKFGTAAPHAIHKAIVELGPTSFITTNYDTLVEQALGVWRSDTFFPAPVTNKHLVELADILSARSSHFVFKPHGDVNDVATIILTREQYRLLLPGGERHNALEALKTLLVTRPVLYLGFGLRDPDFIYLRDLLLNIYQGAVRDHWAIMPDVTSLRHSHILLVDRHL